MGHVDAWALDFPELTIVGGHVGFPWIDEIVSLALKYPNFYVDTSAYALHRLPSAFRAFLKGGPEPRPLGNQLAHAVAVAVSGTAR